MPGVFERFRTLPVADAVHDLAALPASAAAYDHQTLTLGWEDRMRARARRRTDSGVEFATSLPRGTVLREGDCLVLDAVSLLVVVHERAEPVVVIAPGGAADWALVAYQIGNRHLPIMITASAILMPDTLGAVLLLEQCGVRFERAERPFTPSAAIADHQHLRRAGP